MSSEWRELPLGECLLKVVDNRGKTPPLAESKTPYGLIEVNALVGPDKAPNYSAVRKFVSAETYSSWFRSGHPVSGDLLFSTVGSVAEVALFNGGSGCIAQNIVGLRPNTEIISPNYLYYALVNPVMQLKLKTLDISSVQPSIKVPHLLAAKIQVPPFHLQERIGDILESLDDRITLLRETNATLEAIAQALFKSWFVDFDPVRAKAEGRQPEDMNATTAALFPDSFEESELGLVPKGWACSIIGQSFILTMGQSPPGDTYNEIGEGLPFYQGRTDFGFRFPKQRVFCTEPTRLAITGDTLVSVRAPVGDVNIALEECALGRGVAGLRHPEGHQSFVFYAVRCLKPYFEMYDGEGTVFGSINKKDFQALPIVVPSEKLLTAFEAVVAPLDVAIENNEQKLRSLTQLRDTLLPRLISGQLRLPEAETLLGGSL